MQNLSKKNLFARLGLLGMLFLVAVGMPGGTILDAQARAQGEYAVRPYDVSVDGDYAEDLQEYLPGGSFSLSSGSFDLTYWQNLDIDLTSSRVYGVISFKLHKLVGGEYVPYGTTFVAFEKYGPYKFPAGGYPGRASFSKTSYRYYLTGTFKIWWHARLQISNWHTGDEGWITSGIPWHGDMPSPPYDHQGLLVVTFYPP